MLQNHAISLRSAFKRFALVLVLFASLGLLALQAPTVAAAGTTYQVNTDADRDDGSCDVSGQGTGNHDCTLREAINAANANSGADTIQFSGDFPITLTAALPTVTGDTTIDGGTHQILIYGSDTYRILTVETAITLNVNRLYFHRGGANPPLANGSSGGAIYNAGGTLNVSNSAFDYNSASFDGGAIYSKGQVIISNSDFYWNSANGVGGGVAADNATVINSTFSENQGPVGAGLYISGLLTLRNTILGYSPGPDCTLTGSVVSAQNNMIQDTGGDACALSNGVNHEQIGVEPGVDILQYAGGVTPVLPLELLSRAIDAGDDGVCVAAPVNGQDQRGTIRPQHGQCDIGAFEFAASDCGVGLTGRSMLLKPVENKMMNKTKIAFDWTDAVCATSYKIVVKNTTTHTKVTKRVTLSQSKLTLAHGKQEWFVYACDALGCTKSLTFKFTN